MVIFFGMIIYYFCFDDGKENLDIYIRTLNILFTVPNYDIKIIKKLYITKRL